jgi:hypothetical protein
MDGVLDSEKDNIYRQILNSRNTILWTVEVHCTRPSQPAVFCF